MLIIRNSMAMYKRWVGIHISFGKSNSKIITVARAINILWKTFLKLTIVDTSAIDYELIVFLAMKNCWKLEDSPENVIPKLKRQSTCSY